MTAIVSGNTRWPREKRLVHVGFVAAAGIMQLERVVAPRRAEKV